jgi:hypothetical protein
MKNATLLLSIFASVLLAGCAGVSPTRIIGNTVAAAGGAFIGKRMDSTPHPGPLLVRGGEGELFCGT